jgi:transposase-like protein
MIANCKNGVSSHELARSIGVTQKTAWFMLQRIRLAMQESGGKLGGKGGTVEVDETFIGGKARMMNRRRHRAAVKAWGPYQSGKAIVMGMLERGGKVMLHHIKDTQRRTLLGLVVKNVERGSEVHTDELSSYQGLVEPHYAHKVVNHTETYVAGNVHTNGIENFWSLLKRTIRGTYVSVEPFHLFRYLDEQAFRFNGRKESDGVRFMRVVRSIVGRRLTYKHLIGEVAVSPT